jgi:hypothetical protein
LIVATLVFVTATVTHVRSYSQLKQYLDCPRQFQLARMAKVPQRPGVWLPAGVAVHAAIEEYLLLSLREGTK